MTKVWIAPGCIVCDACENDCPEVFDVQEETCIIRPPAQNPDYLKPLTPSIKIAAEGCPVEVIKFETKVVEGPAPWKDQPEGAPAPATAGAGAAAGARAPAAKAAVPMAPPDPKWQALLSTSKVSPSLSAGLASTMRRSPEINQTEEIVRAVDTRTLGLDWKHAPPDQRAALLSVAGAYQPAPSLAQRLRGIADKAGAATRVSRRGVNLALAAGWSALALVGLAWGGMFQDFFGPKVLKEPKKQWRVGRLEQFTQPSIVDESFKRTPAGSEGFWLVNLQPVENKLVALSTICTHLGCIPFWDAANLKYKCPCHGSGYRMNGINFEGPTPRPLERFAIHRDSDGYVVVDQTKIFRQELGEWENPDSYIELL